jgi:hypothetical protein
VLLGRLLRPSKRGISIILAGMPTKLIAEIIAAAIASSEERNDTTLKLPSFAKC